MAGQEEEMDEQSDSKKMGRVSFEKEAYHRRDTVGGILPPL